MYFIVAATCANKTVRVALEQFVDELDSFHQTGAIVAEGLRRLTRNQFPFGSVGSNPTNCEYFLPAIMTIITMI
jgi:hypothetical protein